MPIRAPERTRRGRTRAAALALAAVLSAAVPGCGGPGPADRGAARTLGAGAGTGTGAAATRQADGRHTEAALRAAVRRLAAEGSAPGAAALARDGDGTRFASAGLADLRTGRRILRNDRFRAGSITKTLIATVVLQLADERRLGLDDTVEEHLPGLVRGRGNDGRKITLRQLLTHTSGLFDFAADQRVARRLSRPPTAAPLTPRQLVRTAVAHRPRFAPGAAWHYSNTNYVLLGLVVQRVTGRPYAAETERRVLGPLGLRGTSFPGARGTLPTPHGRGYAPITGTGTGTPRDVTVLDPSAAGAAGEAISTLDDLARFFGALPRGGLLPPAALRRMRDTTASDGRYGMGLFPVRLSCGVTLWGHNGQINGSYAQVVATPDGRRVLAYRLNTEARPAAAAERALLKAEFCRT
ncbi:MULTISPECIES: serine hydrolase domain-containing protein [Streptomyces]|uniref:Serine hydrolase domain-containing protein n=1 Tax=Streptomyces lonegramiae TaxID=3075524 RepID=A0ABU2XK04_9ACTN|nr:serine hydrolase domain-containing protein [Streptomyces sp. DSM 41529]MDT0546258.1 serine hydrolase domain-containing protein [Streptomyces sp. DSM 41529]